MKLWFPSFRFLRRITGSIAFLPSIIAVFFLALGITLLYIEESESFTLLKDQISFAIVKNADTARNILGVLIGGVISLMVFSFSMVMVMLSQALSTLSPRVVPGIISDKRHQVVLGFYLGTLLYLFLVMLNLKPGSQIIVIQLNVLVAIITGIISLILFTYFIHTISQGIQVDVILEDIYSKTRHQILKIDSTVNENIFPDEPPEGYTMLVTEKEGYYNGFNEMQLIDYCKKVDCTLYITIRHGSYVFPGMPIGYVSKQIAKDEQVFFMKYINQDNNTSDKHYFYGLKDIAEIGVKALSPGINDPGTALKAINLLTVLMLFKMHRPERNYCVDSNNVIRILFKPLDFKTLLYHFYAPIRTYAKKDIIVILNLLRAFDNLIRKDKIKREYVTEFHDQMRSILNDIETCIPGMIDRTMCNMEIKKINELNYFLSPLPMFKTDKT